MTCTLGNFSAPAGHCIALTPASADNIGKLVTLVSVATGVVLAILLIAVVVWWRKRKANTSQSSFVELNEVATRKE